MINNITDVLISHGVPVEKRAGLKVSTALPEYMKIIRARAGEAKGFAPMIIIRKSVMIEKE